MPRTYARTPMDERFWSKVDQSGDCWEWTAGKNPSGYGIIPKPGRAGVMLAHRYSAMLHFGMFDQRLLVLHHCDNPGCVRPDHLYLGDHADNMRDRDARGRRRTNGNETKTHCPQGHPYSPDNTFRYKSDGRRSCRECMRAHKRRYRAEGRID